MKKSPSVKYSCRFCQWYQPQINSNGEPNYDGPPACSLMQDTNPETLAPLPDFDRDAERPCCDLDVWLVMDEDKAIRDLFNREMDNPNGSFEPVNKLFNSLYG